MEYSDEPSFHSGSFLYYLEYHVYYKKNDGNLYMKYYIYLK